MAKKGSNSKADAANAKKAASKAEKDKGKAMEMEAKEADKWSQGAKGKNKKEAEADKKAALLAKKQEAARLLAEEEKSLPSKAKGSEKVAAKRSAKADAGAQVRRTIPEFSATNIDDAIDLLSIDDKNARAKDVEKHPERRFKAALAAYEERELPRFKQDNPGLRLTQLKEIMYKAFQKSPDNPFNQANVVTYNATREDAQTLKDQKRQELESRLRS
ncbi:hypothetical protein DFQ28_006843 [Apophysomyces sp. BC1034]|nr:hypothetical protein DFQ30_006736 [Apophysomyces sp. BC1015]KAG0176794.1 hypothetical protein DFQ29_005645 [Apophysomyces sp. BC1021]KAG0187111.1 hypothetical protein DFQ28_006843 [Apophysomyces sp. BC1034]